MLRTIAYTTLGVAAGAGVASLLWYKYAWTPAKAALELCVMFCGDKKTDTNGGSKSEGGFLDSLGQLPSLFFDSEEAEATK